MVGGGGGLGRRARDLQGYIVLWLMARAMMVNGFTTVRTQPAFFSLTKNETKRRRKKCFLQIFSSTQKGKFQSASTFFELCVCITFRVSGIYNYRLFTTLFILLKELSRINTLRIVGLFVYQLLTLS